MRVFIPSCGRATPEKQSSLKFLNSINIPFTIVVRPEEHSMYSALHHDVQVCPTPGIGHTRDFIVFELSGGEPVVMLDDDLQFFVRREDDPTKFRAGEPDEFLQMFKQIETNLAKYPLVGIASREGGNRITDQYQYDTRILRLLAYDPKVLIKHDIKFSDIPVMEDFHVALSLLRAGYHNLVLNNYCHNQFGSGLEGGCSEYRTPEVQASAAHELKRRHPDFVKVVTKETKTAWGGGTRTDVQIQWKKAFNHENR